MLSKYMQPKEKKNYHWPVQHVHVKIIKLEILERTFAGGSDMLWLVMSVPELSGYKDLLAGDTAFADSFADRLFGLV